MAFVSLVASTTRIDAIDLKDYVGKNFQLVNLV